MQEAMQKFGRFLSAMVMPNIGAFIAWGFITALFIPAGWIPNETLAELVGPMAKWLLPLLIGFTGGEVVNGHRGGVVGAIATAGIIVGTDIPMFMGAMIMGPIGGIAIKKFDEAAQDSIPGGFEMLVNNFSAGIIGGILACVAVVFVGPIVSSVTDGLASAVGAIVSAGLLPLVSILVEPAKILFLNNAINHGVFTPLGMQQAQEVGKSVFFMIESNPGPGLGVLLAYSLFGVGNAKGSAPGAVIIHFFGGIHEIYFPYVLMKPALILAVMAGGVTGVFTLTLLNGGLVAPAAPGSFIAIMAMTAPGAYFANIAAVAAAAGVSFAVSSIFIKATAKSDAEKEDALEAAQANMKAMKAASKGQAVEGEKQVEGKDIKFIVYACDAGMGSSALGAAALRKKLHKDGYKNITVKNFAIGNIPKDAQIVVSHEKLAERARADSPQAEHIWVKDFTNNNVYDVISERLKGGGISAPAPDASGAEEEAGPTLKEGVLLKENVKVGLKTVSKEEAIKAAGELLFKSGYVEKEYIEGMLARERDISTYIGQGIAIPHGENAVKKHVIKTGLVVMQYPQGVKFSDENTAHLIVGIAGKGDDHLAIIANLATITMEYSEEDLQKAYTTKDPQVLFDMFTKG
ncbi:MAG: PTS mannitol transporter subunit IICBA [Selenomonadaceae bacterium]|nr:PTS mannitol transporter subunit IICBA [Selenomonadaceae bacterium]